jgi:hypothetical protein
MKRIRVNAFTLSGILSAIGAAAAACGGATQSPQAPSPSTGAPETSSRPTAEQQRAVDAFAGEWLFHSTITPPGGAPIKADLRMSCAKTAGGRANACTLSGEIPGMPPMEAAVLVGVDRLDNKVHFMAMTSDDELHDHVCAWRDAKNLVCDPLKGGLGGQPINEELSFTFDGEKGSFESVIHFADGTRMVFNASGSRVSTSTAPGPVAVKPVEASAEQKKLVETFLGQWKWDADIAFPNGTKTRAALDLKCRATAGGKASLCMLGASDIGGRPYEAAIMVGHDPFDKSVHFMMMSSDDEVWHRSCSWKGDTMLACGSMRTGVLGMPVTSEVMFDFSGKQGTTRWLTDLGDGKTCLLTAQMTR